METSNQYGQKNTIFQMLQKDSQRNLHQDSEDHARDEAIDLASPYVSEEESDDDGPDMMNLVIAASSDEKHDVHGEGSGYLTEESEAESAVNQERQEDEDDEDEMWRELDEAFRMMEEEGLEEGPE
ncbi:uncharacterized protein [Drosophila tropicalis]|uniref:uncharacterized protein n=1 Tax=Drosophila tropicalis TaxID=46794 RepID=UPI0035AB6886